MTGEHYNYSREINVASPSIGWLPYNTGVEATARDATVYARDIWYYITEMGLPRHWLVSRHWYIIVSSSISPYRRSSDDATWKIKVIALALYILGQKAFRLNSVMMTIHSPHKIYFKYMLAFYFILTRRMRVSRPEDRLGSDTFRLGDFAGFEALKDKDTPLRLDVGCDSCWPHLLSFCHYTRATA